MNRPRLSLLCAAALLVAGCDDKGVLPPIDVAYAGIHFLNAVPDTGEQDYRVVDIPSNAGLFDAQFRGHNRFYQAIEAGQRRVNVFNSSLNPAIASQVLSDTTFAFAQDQNYTFLHAGFARTGSTPARTVWIISDQPPIPAATDIGLRVIHAGAGIGSVDVSFIGPTDTLPDVPQMAGVTFSTVRAYFTRPTATTLRIVATAAGTKTPLLVNDTTPAGTAGTPTGNPIAGTSIAGSVLTVVIVPASVVGSAASQFSTASALFLVDRRPPNTAP